jgi:hypothetical protein
MDQLPSGPALQPSPRAFCQATGVIFQVVGFAMAMSTCCWGFIGAGVISIDRPAATSMAAPSPESQWFMVAAWATFIAGLGGCAVGLALQHERPFAGRACMIMAGAMAVLFWAYAAFTIFQFPGAVRIVTTIALATVWTVLFFLAGHSAELLARFPPTQPERPWTQRDEDDLRSGSSPHPPDKTNP